MIQVGSHPAYDFCLFFSYGIWYYRTMVTVDCVDATRETKFSSHLTESKDRKLSSIWKDDVFFFKVSDYVFHS